MYLPALQGFWGPGSVSVLDINGRCWCNSLLLWALHQLQVPVGFGTVVSAAPFPTSLLMQQTQVLPVPVHTSYRSLCYSMASGCWLLISSGNFNPLISTWDLSAALQPSTSSWAGKLYLPSTLNCLRRGSLTSPGVSGVFSNSSLQTNFSLHLSWSSSSPRFLLSQVNFHISQVETIGAGQDEIAPLLTVSC